MRKRKILISVAPSPEVNVTPLIDIVLVLLIIFMVISPLANEKLSTRLAETVSSVEYHPDPTQIVVHLDKDGAIKINGDSVPLDTYTSILREKLRNRKSEDKLILFDANDAAGYGQFVAVLDGAKQAGAMTLGFVMPEAKSGE